MERTKTRYEEFISSLADRLVTSTNEFGDFSGVKAPKDLIPHLRSRTASLLDTLEQEDPNNYLIEDEALDLAVVAYILWFWATRPESK